MNVNGIGGIGPWTGIQPGGEPRPAKGPQEGTVPVPERAPVRQAEVQQVARQERQLPVDAPAGTDPQLWSVLTSEERTFFARARAMGPLTYGPGAQRGGPAGPARGGRVDIRI